jgi:hypothetical protein
VTDGDDEVGADEQMQLADVEAFALVVVARGRSTTNSVSPYRSTFERW